MTTPAADAHQPMDSSPTATAREVAAEVQARLDAGHQDPEDVRAAAHARWPDHVDAVDDSVDAHLHGQAVQLTEPEQRGQDVAVDPSLHGELAAEPEPLDDGQD